MTQPIERDAIYRRRRFSRDTIETCVRWYLTYRLSSRDLVAMMAERGIRVSHSTILRWVFRYVPEYERRFNQRSRRVASSWRVDETYIRVGAEMMYLYRGVDKYGKTVASLLSPTRSMEAGMEFFRRAGTNRILRKLAFFNKLFEVVPAAELGRFPGPVMLAAEAGAASLDALFDATVQFIAHERRL